jgi:hypothetical protein
MDFAVTNNAASGRRFAVKDAAGSPVNITGWQFRMHVRREAASRVVEVEFSSAAGDFVVIDAAAGQFQVVFAAAKLAQLPAQTYVHDLVITPPDAERKRLYRGTFTVEQGVTR